MTLLSKGIEYLVREVLIRLHVALIADENLGTCPLDSGRGHRTSIFQTNVEFRPDLPVLKKRFKPDGEPPFQVSSPPEGGSVLPGRIVGYSQTVQSDVVSRFWSGVPLIVGIHAL